MFLVPQSCCISKTYSCHAEITEDTTSLTTSNTSVLDLGGTGVAVHLRQLQLSLGAGALWQECVADDVAECLSKSQCDQYTVLQTNDPDMTRCVANLSVSFCSKTLRLVWSRMTLMLTKPPRSSFFERNMDMIVICDCVRSNYSYCLCLPVVAIHGGDSGAGGRLPSGESRVRSTNSRLGNFDMLDIIAHCFFSSPKTHSHKT
jgi:hypothetical protein